MLSCKRSRPCFPRPSSSSSCQGGRSTPWLGAYCQLAKTTAALHMFAAALYLSGVVRVLIRLHFHGHLPIHLRKCMLQCNANARQSTSQTAAQPLPIHRLMLIQVLCSSDFGLPYTRPRRYSIITAPGVTLRRPLSEPVPCFCFCNRLSMPCEECAARRSASCAP